MIDLSPVSRLIVSLKNVKDRLMLTVPVIDARIIPAHQVDVGEANLYLLRLDIYPARRQAEFNKVTVENCRLMKFAQRRTKRGETLYIPDYEKGVFNDFSFLIVVPPEARQTTPISLMFFIEPKENQKMATVKLKSPYWFMSTECNVKLNQKDDAEVSFIR